VATFALASILHGMAVVAIANRYSRSFPPAGRERPVRVRAIAPLVLLLLPARSCSSPC